MVLVSAVPATAGEIRYLLVRGRCHHQVVDPFPPLPADLKEVKTMDWLRFYVSTLDNAKVQKLPGELFKAWVNILCVARQNEGVLPSIPDMAFSLRCTEKQVDTWVKELIQRRLLDRNGSVTMPHDWDEHQHQSDSSSERVRRFRERKRNERLALQSVAETTAERFCNVIEQSRAEQSTEQSRADSAATNCASVLEWPETAAAVRSRWPSADDALIYGIISASVQAYVSTRTGDPPPLTDEQLCQAIPEATTPHQRSPGLYLHTVPQIIKSWSLEVNRAESTAKNGRH